MTKFPRRRSRRSVTSIISIVHLKVREDYSGRVKCTKFKDGASCYTKRRETFCPQRRVCIGRRNFYRPKIRLDQIRSDGVGFQISLSGWRSMQKLPVSVSFSVFLHFSFFSSIPISSGFRRLHVSLVLFI